MLIAIEGIDGAGKRTLTDKLRNLFQADGKSVAMLAFPRYGQSVTADIAAEALHGEHGDLASSVYAMAMLFALDRAGAVDEIAALRREHDEASARLAVSLPASRIRASAPASGAASPAGTTQ